MLNGQWTKKDLQLILSQLSSKINFIQVEVRKNTSEKNVESSLERS